MTTHQEQHPPGNVCDTADDSIETLHEAMAALGLRLAAAKGCIPPDRLVCNTQMAIEVTLDWEELDPCGRLAYGQLRWRHQAH